MRRKHHIEAISIIGNPPRSAHAHDAEERKAAGVGGSARNVSVPVAMVAAITKPIRRVCWRIRRSNILRVPRQGKQVYVMSLAASQPWRQRLGAPSEKCSAIISTAWPLCA